MKYYIEVFYSKSPQESKEFGRIVSKNHFLRVKKIVDADKSKIIFGGKYDENDLYISPTILDGVDEDDSCMKEELFGPLLPIKTYDNIKNAVEFVKNPKYPIREKPLGLYVFSSDSSVSDYVMKNTQSGGACVNDTYFNILI
jgi:aldehyde dehydrogenase (NAD+)